MRIPAVLFACGLALGAYSLNASSNAGLPEGWSIGGEAPKLYATDVDTSDSPSGKGSVELRRTETSHEFGGAHLVQRFPVEPYAGKRVKVSMHVRFQGTETMAGAVYIGTGNGAHSQNMEFDDNWTWLTCILSLPADAERLDIGVGMKGPGSAKVDAIELQVLGDAPADLRGTRISDTKLFLNGRSREIP